MINKPCPPEDIFVLFLSHYESNYFTKMDFTKLFSLDKKMFALEQLIIR